MEDQVKFTEPLDSTTPYALVYATNDFAMGSPSGGYPGYDVDTVREANARALAEMDYTDLDWYASTSDAEEEIDPLSPPAAFRVGREDQIYALDTRMSILLDDAEEPEEWHWFDVIAGLSNDPLIDDELHSEVETERLAEYIAETGLWDLRHDLKALTPDDETIEDQIDDETGPFDPDALTALFHYAMHATNLQAEYDQEGTYVDTRKLAELLAWSLGWYIPKTPDLDRVAPGVISGWYNDATKVAMDKVLSTDDPSDAWGALWAQYCTESRPEDFDPENPYGAGHQPTEPPVLRGFLDWLASPWTVTC